MISDVTTLLHGDQETETGTEVENHDSQTADIRGQNNQTVRRELSSRANSADDRPVALDDIFEILKNQRRRQVLEYLDGETGPVTMSDLAEQIAAWENQTEPRLVSSTERKRVYVGLYQCHLPKMDDTGAVEYDKPRGVVEAGEHFDSFTRYLPSAESAPPSRRIFRGLVEWGLSLLGRDTASE